METLGQARCISSHTMLEEILEALTSWKPSVYLLSSPAAGLVMVTW